MEHPPPDAASCNDQGPASRVPMMKAMQAEAVERGQDYRVAARAAVVDGLANRMALAIDGHLERMAERGQADRRKGGYRRWLPTELGAIELAVPRTPGSVRRVGSRRTLAGRAMSIG